MALNENVVKGKWREIKGDVQKIWGKLTDDELEQTKGDMKAISGLIQQKYGEAQESQSKKLAAIFAQLEDKKDSAMEKTNEKLKNLRDFE